MKSQEGSKLNPLKLYMDYYQNWLSFTTHYSQSLIKSAFESSKQFFEKNNQLFDIQKSSIEAEKAFDINLRNELKEQDLAESLSDLIKSYSFLAEIHGFDKLFQYYNNFLIFLNKFMDPFRDTLCRTPSEIIKMEGKFDLHHYKYNKKPKYKTPIVVVGSIINRYYILDVLPKISIIRNLQKQGFDIYAIDWNMPASFDRNLSLEVFSHSYLDQAVDKIREVSGADSVSLFGYCWGGIFSLIYATIHPEKVKNLVLHATPFDLDQESTTIEKWTQNLDPKVLADCFGNIPATFLNNAFILRNPIETVLKYPRFFKKPRNVEDIMQFFQIETWLYDSVPIPGKTYEKIINDIYKKNLLAKNELFVKDQKIDLNKITLPVLNIVGTKDDLVPPRSSLQVNKKINSNDKKTIKFPTGHVGLCITQKAHQELWPQVGNWLSSRSD